MKRVYRTILLFALLVGLFGRSRHVDAWPEDGSGLPMGIKNSQNPMDKSLSPQESLARISVPEGFKVSLFAGEPDVAQPISFTFDDRGRLWVVECFSHPKWQATGNDRILIFEDKNGDGRFDQRKVFWDKGHYLTGILMGHGGVWICNTPYLQFIPDKDGDDVPDGPPVTLLDGWTRRSPHNVINNLIWGPDGWMYGSIGQSNESRVGKPGTPDGKRTRITRGIWRFHPARKAFEVVARGCVNPWGLDFDDHGEGFFSNCVLPHLWHLIPGARYDRRPGETDSQHIYSRIAPICDHLHWGGGTWQSSRGGQGEHSKAGGGHAHTGAMVYLGDNWPDRYRHTYFVGNIHGNRINNDVLGRSGSGYVGRHRPDFLMANDRWFRSLSQKYGPDGGVFMSDWHDFGECHDSDGTHRTSGRIYKITYGSPKHRSIDLGKLSNTELVKLQLHKNDWFVRHARRLLHERSANGDDMRAAKVALHMLFVNQPDVSRKLRVLWALNLIDGLSNEFLAKQLSHSEEHVRSWAIRLIVDDMHTPKPLETLTQLAATDKSSLVRLYLAAALQRLPLDDRWAIAEQLVRHAKDSKDQNLPHMIWYGIEPLIKRDQVRAIKMLKDTKISLLRQHIARRAASK